MSGLLESTVRRRLSPGVVLLGAVLVLIFLFMAALAAGWFSARQRVRAELDRIRAAGEPVTAEDLEHFYRTPPTDLDATQLWLKAISTFDSPEFAADAKGLPIVDETAQAPPPLDEAWPQQPMVEALLGNYRESLETMHRAAELGGAARYPVNFERGYEMLLPHAQRLRNAGRLLELEAETRARRQDRGGTIESIAAIHAAARSLEHEPILVSQLVRLALDGIARGQLQRRLSDTRFTDDELAALDRQLTAIDYSEVFARGVAGERVCGLMVFHDPKSLGDQAPPALSGLFRSSDQAVYLQVTRKMMSASHFDGPRLREAAADAEADLKQLAREPGARLRCPISMLTLPGFSNAVIAIQRGIAGRDTARAAVAIERFRLRHGEPPQTLDAMVPEFLPEVPSDPFDGKPLRYRMNAEDYLVYSVEADGVEQGGQSTETRPGMPQDLVFRVRLNSAPPKAPEPF